MGGVTLLLFPIPTFLGLYYFEDIDPIAVVELEHLDIVPVTFGLMLGYVYALIALLFMQSPVFDPLPNRVEHLVRRMNLSVFDCIFLSICAGVGEELLFRSGVQFYLGPWITSVLFVAIHGYLNPWNWRMSIYGLIVLPFIVLISFGLEQFGLWFCIAAHFSYDLVLFLAMRSAVSAPQS
jgi:membrane protease YdiL (CAAX protease family)